MDDVLVGGIVADAPLGSAAVPDGPLAGAVVVEQEIDVELGAGQGIAGAAGKDGRDGAPVAVVVRPERSYSVAVLPGQTIVPISPPPSDPNGFALIINGVAYGPPTITVSAVAVTWLGSFPLDPSDDVRVRYL